MTTGTSPFASPSPGSDPSLSPLREGRRFHVTGVVQGVGFRWSCVREAERLGVGGWVRNRADGSVEVVAEGAPNAVERLLRWCARGPRHAQVVSTDITPEEPRGLAGFDVFF